MQWGQRSARRVEDLEAGLERLRSRQESMRRKLKKHTEIKTKLEVYNNLSLSITDYGSMGFILCVWEWWWTGIYVGPPQSQFQYVVTQSDVQMYQQKVQRLQSQSDCQKKVLRVKSQEVRPSIIVPYHTCTIEWVGSRVVYI